MKEIVTRLAESMLTNFSKTQIDEVSTYLHVILHDYDISRRETAITVYNGDYNEQLIKKFLATKLVAGCSPRTIKMYENALKMFTGKAQKLLVDITTDDILYYLALRNTIDHLSAVSQDNELRVLKSFYTWALEEELITKNPAMKVPKVRGTKKVKQAFTETELELMRNACNTRDGLNVKHLAILEVLISTGCRAMELTGMKMENLEGDKIKILGKGNKERWVYLTPRAQIALQNWLKVRPLNSPYIFTGVNITTGVQTECLGRESVNDIVKNIAKRAGVEGCHAHKFRRTAATLALRRGMPIELVSKMLGHEQLTTTQIYLQITDDELQQAHRKYC